jgi:hypothetical protein
MLERTLKRVPEAARLIFFPASWLPLQEVDRLPEVAQPLHLQPQSPSFISPSFIFSLRPRLLLVTHLQPHLGASLQSPSFHLATSSATSTSPRHFIYGPNRYHPSVHHHRHSSRQHSLLRPSLVVQFYLRLSAPSGSVKPFAITSSLLAPSPRKMARNKHYTLKNLSTHTK